MTTIIKITAYGDDSFYRCNLSQASAPLQVWSGDCWESTQYQCADCRHRTEEMAELAMALEARDHEIDFDDFEAEWEVLTGLNEDADTDHEDARDWYGSYGWHLVTEHAGHVTLQAVEFDWLDDDDDAVIKKLMASNDGLSEEEADSLVSQARAIREVAEEVESQLVAAVEAYEAGDYAACKEALDACERIEAEHGDTPASSTLRSELLDESVADILA